MPDMTAVPMNPSKVEYFGENGHPIRPVLRWDQEHKHVIKVGEEDLQKFIDDAAVGMSIGEQLARLSRGDLSVLRPEGQFIDVSGLPETDGEAMVQANQAVIDAAKKVQEEKAAKLAEAQKELKEAEDKLAEAENGGK